MSWLQKSIPLTWLKLIFRSLNHRNYQYYFWGQCISLMGTWIQNIALGWLVYRLTGSVIFLGVMAFAVHIPSLVITPFAGVYADRLNRQKTLIITQLLAMFITIALALVVLFELVTVWNLMVFAVLIGIVNAFDTPFRHAFVMELVGNRDDLPNAIALNSTLFNAARFIGPIIGGILISLVGEGWCFMINGISFLAVVVSLRLIRVEPFKPVLQTQSTLLQLKEGLNYSWNNKPVRYLLLMIAVTGFAGLPFQSFLPAFASGILQGGAPLLGMLTGSLGAGALAGALYLASRQNIRSLPKGILFSVVIFVGGMSVFSQSLWPAVSMMGLAVAGFGMIFLFNATNTLLQTITDDSKRGRMVSLYSLTFMGIPPLGSLAMGAVAELAGIAFTVLVSALICLATVFLLRKKIKGVEQLL